MIDHTFINSIAQLERASTTEPRWISRPDNSETYDLFDATGRPLDKTCQSPRVVRVSSPEALANAVCLMTDQDKKKMVVSVIANTNVVSVKAWFEGEDTRVEASGVLRYADSFDAICDLSDSGRSMTPIDLDWWLRQHVDGSVTPSNYPQLLRSLRHMQKKDSTDEITAGSRSIGADVLAEVTARTPDGNTAALPERIGLGTTVLECFASDSIFTAVDVAVRINHADKTLTLWPIPDSLTRARHWATNRVLEAFSRVVDDYDMADEHRPVIIKDGDRG